MNNRQDPFIDIKTPRQQPSQSPFQYTPPRQAPTVLAAGAYTDDAKAVVYSAGAGRYVEIMNYTVSSESMSDVTAELFIRLQGGAADGSEDIRIAHMTVSSTKVANSAADGAGSGIAMPENSQLVIDTSSGADVRYLISGFIYTRNLEA